MSEPTAIDLDRLIVKAKMIAKSRHGLQEQDIVAHQVRFEKWVHEYVIIELYTKYMFRIEVWFKLGKTEDNTIIPVFDNSVVKPIIECVVEA